MRQPRPNLTRIAIQDQILAKFGEEWIQAARARLCNMCSFHILSGRPCQLLPITLEGADCPYFSLNVISDPGGDHDG